jgi:hypothetical protein
LLCARQAIARIERKPCSKFFRKPVDEALAPGYYLLITSPMDLSTLKARLASRHDNSFPDVVSFAKAGHLIFSNCRLYNPDTPENKVLLDMCADTEAEFDKVRGWLPTS